ncbi:hypothetical protein PC121_g10280 [Phytophthora cactorum]|nr:hypothetical protein PC121_g10280 [Phytophthora cactorum]
MPRKRALTEAQPVKRKQRRPRQGAGAHSNYPTHLASTLDFNGNPGVVQIGDRHQHAVDRASHTAEATAADAGLAACRRDDAGAEAGAARAHAQSLVAGEHSNAGGAAIAHAGRGGEGDDRIVGGADFGPGKTTTSSSNTKLVAALVRSKGCTSESDNMTMVAARVSLQ